MNKNTKTHTTQISTTRRKVLKKLSYSPPLLMCLGTLTKPKMAGASHGGMPLDRNTWQTGTQEGMDSVDRYNMGLARPGANIANLVEMLNSDYVAYVAAYNAEHEI